MGIQKFLIYNNTTPLVLGVVFLSSSLAFAASEDVREFVTDTVYTSEQAVVSIDNSYIAHKNLDTYSPRVAITSVTEDSERFYVTYTFITIALSDAVWQDVQEERVMEVPKTALGDYADLGVYVTEQLKQLVATERAYLREVQSIEKQNITSKVVATAYSGLVGQFIDEDTETLPGYTPRVRAPQNTDVDPVAVATQAQNNDGTASVRVSEADDDTSRAPVITILGSNPARVAVGSQYSDLGVVVTSHDGVTLDLSIETTLNSEVVDYVNIDTDSAADWAVGYTVTDRDGVSAFAERVVIVYDSFVVADEETETATTTATTTPTEEVDAQEETQASSTPSTHTDETAGTDTATSTDVTEDESTEDVATTTATTTPEEL